MTTDRVLEILQERGLIPAARKGKLILRGDREGWKEEVTEALRKVLLWHKQEILARIGVPCPDCGGKLDRKGICWKIGCWYRACVGCGTRTGSQFVARCFVCGASQGRGTSGPASPNTAPETDGEISPVGSQAYLETGAEADTGD